MWVSFLSIRVYGFYRARGALFFLSFFELFRSYIKISHVRIVPNLLAQATIKYAKVIECCRLLGNREKDRNRVKNHALETLGSRGGDDGVFSS